MFVFRVSVLFSNILSELIRSIMERIHTWGEGLWKLRYIELLLWIVTGFCSFGELSLGGVWSSRVHYYLENKNSNYNPFQVTAIHLSILHTSNLRNVYDGTIWLLVSHTKYIWSLDCCLGQISLLVCCYLGMIFLLTSKVLLLVKISLLLSLLIVML